jgi:hypothetical protein
MKKTKHLILVSISLPETLSTERSVAKQVESAIGVSQHYKVENKDESLIWFINEPSETMNLLFVVLILLIIM